MIRRDFQKLIASVKQAGSVRRGKARASRVFRFKPADVKAIRIQLKQSQPEFALMIGVSVATQRNWEQGAGFRMALPKSRSSKPS